MIVRAHFFAPLNLIVGVEETELELPDPATGTDFVRCLKAKFADTLPAQWNLMLLVNQGYVDPLTGLKDGDRVSVIAMKSCCH